MPTRLALFVPLFIALLAADARGQAPGQVRPAQPEKSATRRKSPLVAAGLSAGIPLAGLGIVAVAGNTSGALPGALAMYVGPSVGQWYAGGSAAVGLLGRTAGGALMIAAILEAQEKPEAENRSAKAVFVGGAVLWTAATVYDVVMAHRAAGKYNREHALTVAPVMVPAAGSARAAPGLGLSGRF